MFTLPSVSNSLDINIITLLYIPVNIRTILSFSIFQFIFLFLIGKYVIYTNSVIFLFSLYSKSITSLKKIILSYQRSDYFYYLAYKISTSIDKSLFHSLGILTLAYLLSKFRKVTQFSAIIPLFLNWLLKLSYLSDFTVNIGVSMLVHK